MSWVILIISGLLEVIGVTGMQKITNDKKKTIGVILMFFGFISSIILMRIAMQDIPLAIAYAVWTGMGTLGSALIGMIFYRESKNGLRLFYLFLIVAAVVGLRFLG